MLDKGNSKESEIQPARRTLRKKLFTAGKEDEYNQYKLKQ